MIKYICILICMWHSSLRSELSILLAGDAKIQYPSIGFYANPYDFLTASRIALVLPGNVGMIPSEMGKVDHFSIVLVGNSLDKPNLNVVFHSLLSQWMGIHDNFVRDIQAGLFHPNGVQAQSMSNGVMAALQVHLHDQSYSPNNGVFVIDAGRKVVSFWIKGELPNTPNHVVTLFVIVCDAELKTMLAAWIDAVIHEAWAKDLSGPPDYNFNYFKLLQVEEKINEWKKMVSGADLQVFDRLLEMFNKLPVPLLGESLKKTDNDLRALYQKI